ncbi:DoxX family protein [Methylomonas sp. SURF-1]|uniref:DoxX family protein n=1 Tax=Methylomonas aurea TaxID=2952224 RepID=A0ABT1UJN0_9GAMM|nr:DoxX family protein [Methylomonas sp. SURF-1]MCQ8182446.1 DoxX family protein [Methylomonas sp. SURF-1]
MNITPLNTVIGTLIGNIPDAMRLSSRFCDKAGTLDFLAPLLIRLYLAPVFWMAGTKKFASFSDTAEWFGNAEWGLGLPAPYVLVFLVALFELVGALCLLFGFATRPICLPLMVIMVVAAVSAHLQNGWLAIATGSGIFATDRTTGAIERLERAKEILQAQGDYEWITENGALVILNNGIEFAATYFVMLLALFFLGGGRFVSADYWLRRHYGIE